MASLWPGAFDTFANPAATDPRSSPSLADLVAREGDALEAMQTDLGLNPSPSVGSIRYQLKDLAGGHHHDGVDSRIVSFADMVDLPATFPPAAHSFGSHTGIPSEFTSAAHTASKHTFKGSRVVSGLSGSNFDFTSIIHDTGSFADLAGNRFVFTTNGTGWYALSAGINATGSNSSTTNQIFTATLLLNGVAIDRQIFTASKNSATLSDWGFSFKLAAVRKVLSTDVVTATFVQSGGFGFTSSDGFAEVTYLGVD